MSNIFNDITKIVKAAKEFEKIIADKPTPKPARVKSIQLTEDEYNRIMMWFLQCDEELSKMVGYRQHHNLYEKIKKNWRELKAK